MSNKLDSVRRSLFKEFDDDDSLGKSYNDAHKTQRTTIKLNGTFIAIVIVLTLAIAAFSNKVIQSLAKEMYSELSNKIDANVDFTQINSNHLIVPLIYATLISCFSMIIIYFDSEIPGVCPPTPFSPRKARLIRYSVHKEMTNHLGFMVAIFSGVVTFFLLYL